MREPRQIIDQIIDLLRELLAVVEPEMSMDMSMDTDATHEALRARWREDKKKQRAKNVHGHVHGHRPPKKGPPDPLKEHPLSKTEKVRRTVTAIWANAPQIARRRSSQKTVALAVAGRVEHGCDPDEMVTGCQRFYGDADLHGGQYATGVHIVVRDELWRSYLEQQPQRSDVIEQARLRFVYGDDLPLEASDVH